MVGARRERQARRQPGRDPEAQRQEVPMTLLHEIPAARPFALAGDEGERIWFTNTSMTIKAAAATTGGELTLIESVAPVGFGPPLHVHHDEHEAFYVLEGELEVVCGAERYRAAAGAFAFLPRGVAHTFLVAGDRPARFLSISSPGGFEGFFRGVGRPAEAPALPPREPVDIARLREVGERFNVEIVGPPLGAGD
jgi:mannose-6-phosphate isomerase-like protein (cupin superfamily)